MTQFDENAFSRIFGEDEDIPNHKTEPTSQISRVEEWTEEEMANFFAETALSKSELAELQSEFEAANQKDEVDAKELGEELDAYMDDACRSEEEGWYYSDED